MSLQITPVHDARGVDAFVKLPHDLYAGDPHYVSPIFKEQKQFLDPGHNPFFAHAESQLWLAQRDGRTVGRVAACVDRYHNEAHDEQTGFFGFYEAPEEPDVASALLDTASTWLRERNMQVMRGPGCFTTNHDYLGLLVEGKPGPPVVGMPYNPPYYIDQFEDYGLAKCKDLWSWHMDASDMKIPSKVQKIIDGLMQSDSFIVRPFDMKNFERDASIVRELYNACWSQNWGFIPMDDAEFAYTAKDMKSMVDPDFLLVAEAEGKPIGFCLTIPDFNQALKPCKGKLFPFGFLKFLLAKRKIRYARTLLLGVLPEFRHRGVDVMMVYKTYKAGFARGVTSGECSWILEDNTAMNRILKGLGATVYRTYRVFDLDL